VTPKNDNASVSASNGEALVQNLLLFSSVIQAGSSRTCVFVFSSTIAAEAGALKGDSI